MIGLLFGGTFKCIMFIICSTSGTGVGTCMSNATKEFLWYLQIV